MELDAITTMITNIGFPIACVICLFRYLKEREAQRDKEQDKWTEAINNNTRVMEKLLDRMEWIERSLKGGGSHDEQRICGEGD